MGEGRGVENRGKTAGSREWRLCRESWESLSG